MKKTYSVITSKPAHAFLQKIKDTMMKNHGIKL